MTNEYKIQCTNATFNAKTHKQAYQYVSRLLSVDGPRALRAVCNNGAVILASLYDGESHIADSKQRIIYKS